MLWDVVQTSGGDGLLWITTQLTRVCAQYRNLSMPVSKLCLGFLYCDGIHSGMMIMPWLAIIMRKAT